MECFAGDPIKVRLRTKRLNEIKNKKYISLADRLAVYEPLLWFKNNVLDIDLDNVFFAPTYFQTVSSSIEAKKRPDDIESFYDECLQDPSMPPFQQEIRQESLNSAVRLGNDRRMIARQKAENKHKEIVSQRLKVNMFLTFGEAIFAILFLTGRPPIKLKAFPKKFEYTIGPYRIGSRELKAIMGFEELMNELNAAKGHKFSKQDYGSRKFQKHGSTMGDSIHLSVMPLVDIFTCDGAFYQLLETCPSFNRYRYKTLTASSPDFRDRIRLMLKC